MPGNVCNISCSFHIHKFLIHKPSNTRQRGQVMPTVTQEAVSDMEFNCSLCESKGCVYSFHNTSGSQSNCLSEPRKNHVSRDSWALHPIYWIRLCTGVGGGAPRYAWESISEVHKVQLTTSQAWEACTAILHAHCASWRTRVRWWKGYPLNSSAHCTLEGYCLGLKPLAYPASFQQSGIYFFSVAALLWCSLHLVKCLPSSSHPLFI